MFGSDVLDVGIGMSLLFLMMSLIATAIREAIEGWMKSRSKDLEKGLREMLDDRGNFEGMVGQFYNHPLISSLYRGTLAEAKTGDLPSYIPSKTFVAALLDIVLSSTSPDKAAATQANAAAPNADPAAPQGNVALLQAARRPLTIEALKSSTDHLPPRLKSIVLSAIGDAQNDVNAVRANLEAWFNSTMDRVSGWYRRRTQFILFLIGIVAAVALNVDSITIASRLTSDKTLRAAIVATAKTQATAAVSGATKSYDEIATELAYIGYPMGWKGLFPKPQMCDKPDDAPAKPEDKSDKKTDDSIFKKLSDALTSIPGCKLDLSAVPRTIAGWFVTAFAITLGAPFWFDVLNRFMVVRSTVKPSEKSPNEASKDNAAPTPLMLMMAPTQTADAPADPPPKPAVGSG